MKLKLMFAAAALAFTPALAQAQMPEIYVGVHGGKSFANTELTFDGSPFFLDGLGSDGWIGGVHAGSDIKLPGGPFFVGAFGGYTFQTTAFELGTGGGSFKAELGDSWHVGGRVGMFVGAGKVYIGGAYRNTELEMAGLGWTSSRDLTGYDAIVGVTFPLARNLDFGLEGVWTQYNKEAVDPSIPSLKMDTEQLSVMAKLIFNFGGPAEPVAVAAPEPKGCDPKFANCKR